MKKVFICVLGALLLTSVSAKAGVYVSVGAGANKNQGDSSSTSDSYKNSPVYTGAVGYELPIPLVSVRGEVEYLSMTNKLKDGDYSKQMNAAMGNAYVRIPVIGIYGGLGAGYGKIGSDDMTLYQGMLGWEIKIPVTGLTVGAEYRRTQSDSKINADNAEYDYKADSVMLKIRYTF